jgi:uncharacterized protein DUF4238
MIPRMARESHHYVPQVYLRRFFDLKHVAKGVNSLWRYRPGGRPEEKGTKEIAEQTNFYDLPEVDRKDNDIEEMFSQIEGVVAWDLKKLRVGKSICGSSRRRISLITSLCRTRGQREQ